MHRLVLRLVAGFTGLAVLAADGAVAQTCFTLQAELDHLQSSGGGGDRARYERAFREQARVLSRTESRARNAGCFGGGFFFRREPDRSCRTLVPKLRDMQDNMARLDRLRRRGGNGNARRIRAIRGLMEARQCGRPGSERVRNPSRRERIFEGSDPFAGSTFRTLCVRTCDGYYFPISYSTTRQQFAADAQTCSAMCPAAEARLYYHANPGSGPEEMVGLAGEPYSALPTAFQYRTSLNPSCTCKPAGASTIAADPGERPSLEPKKDIASAAPLPGPPRPAPGEDPETLLNRLGDFYPGAAPQDAGTAQAGATSDESVRIVGPVFGTSPEQAGVVLTPVPN